MSQRRVLLIEDGRTYAKLATLLLTGINCRVTWADTAGEGLRLAREQVPDLILMDINLPDMDGFSAVRTLRLEPPTARIPMLALTAERISNETERDKAREAGFDEYVEKPFTEAMFRGLVEPYLGSDSGS